MFFKTFILILCSWLLCLHVYPCITCVCPVSWKPEEVARSIPWNWNYRGYGLPIEPRFSGKVATAVNQWTISPASRLTLTSEDLCKPFIHEYEKSVTLFLVNRSKKTREEELIYFYFGGLILCVCVLCVVCLGSHVHVSMWKSRIIPECYRPSPAIHLTFWNRLSH